MRSLGHRGDWVAGASLALLTLIVTYPMSAHLGPAWWPVVGLDLQLRLWDPWWFGRALETDQPFYATRDLFFPKGLDLAYFPFNWPHIVFVWTLTHFVEPIVAFKLSMLLALFTSALAAYALVRSLGGSVGAAWIAGLVYAFAPHHVGHARAHPGLAHLAPIPLTVLLFLRASRKASPLAGAAAGVALGVTAFTGLYLMVFAVLTLLPLFLFEIVRRWPARWPFWRSLSAFGLTATATLGLRLEPVYADREALDRAIANDFGMRHQQVDLVSYALPSRRNPAFGSWVEASASLTNKQSVPAYLGLVPVVLVFVAIRGRRQRRDILPWAVIGLLFVVLSLGSVLRFGGVVHPEISLPARLLEWLPAIAAVRPHFFHLGLLLPLAVLSGFGMERCLAAARSNRIRALVLSSAGGFLLLEYSNGPFAIRPAPYELEVYEHLGRLPGDFALIEVPLDHYWMAKEYLYFQTIHERPIATGMTSRMSADGFRAVDWSPVLEAWRLERGVGCDRLGASGMAEGLEELLASGFRFVVVHDPLREAFRDGLRRAPTLSDRHVDAWDLRVLAAKNPCEKRQGTSAVERIP